MLWNPLCFDVNDFRKAPFFLRKSSKGEITVELHSQAVASSNKLLCNDLHVRRGTPQNLTGSIPKITSIFHSLWTNARLCVKRCTEKHKNACCNIKTQTRTLCCFFLLSEMGKECALEWSSQLPVINGFYFTSFAARGSMCLLQFKLRVIKSGNEKLYNVVNKIA